MDLDETFDVSLHADINTLKPSDLPWKPDIILASPPCESFSVASMGHHWGGGHRGYEPKTEQAKASLELVKNTVAFVKEVNPTFAVFENPRGVLRKTGILPVDPITIWYCHYGETRAKPTDLWGWPFPPSFSPKAACHNARAGHADDCCCRDHEAAPRGARTGTQGLKTYATRSLVPYELSKAMCLAAEQDL